jgi:hypothetical protein
MGIAVFDLQQLQHFFEILEDPEFLDAGFCEGLPEDKEEPHAVHFGKKLLHRPIPASRAFIGLYPICSVRKKKYCGDI